MADSPPNKSLLHGSKLSPRPATNAPLTLPGPWPVENGGRAASPPVLLPALQAAEPAPRVSANTHSEGQNHRALRARIIANLPTAQPPRTATMPTSRSTSIQESQLPYLEGIPILPILPTIGVVGTERASTDAGSHSNQFTPRPPPARSIRPMRQAYVYREYWRNLSSIEAVRNPTSHVPPHLLPDTRTERGPYAPGSESTSKAPTSLYRSQGATQKDDGDKKKAAMSPQVPRIKTHEPSVCSFDMQSSRVLQNF
ncbi:hypothetical protein BU23DRAFT_237685 [Bimuria novae-zelandiae CBS 107.79]|uniref:Uncharacterized protein n=1 Tax=Bimuria novae-zelandiae CBS 107.79 TaxID=1447943 RepID=A0A6A5V8D2_9PLEO|nr:hypothetical protein BU23DRAFT_237685 [Bimuria novae-zelandiae CBS 107.79]